MSYAGLPEMTTRPPEVIPAALYLYLRFGKIELFL